MPAPLPRFFVTGGTVPPGAPSYIERAADRELFEALAEGEFCHVLTPRQMGKSSLMIRTARRLRQEGAAVVRIDLTALGQNVTPEQWYDGLLATTGDQLDCEPLLDGCWRDHARLGPCQRFFVALQTLLHQPPGPEPGAGDSSRRTASLVIFIDELDTVRSLPFSTDEFFAGIRECYNRRAEEPDFRRLTFCLLGVATPADLIRDSRMTPFNIGRRIELHDFSAGEMQTLAGGLPEQGPAAAREILTRVYHWTHGHPFLTQRLCQSIASGDPSNPLSHTLRLQDVDAACHALFLTPSARIQDDNLQLLRDRLLHSSLTRASVLSLYRRVLRGRPRVRHDETDAVGSVLRLSGVVRVEDGCLRVRNPIYARAFDAAWIDVNTTDVDRRLQRAAFQRGVLRATGIGILVLALLVGLAYALWERQRRLEQVARLDVARGLNRMERGDLMGAFPYFVEALRREPVGTPGEEIARLRIAGLLQAAPTLEQVLNHSAGVAAVTLSADGRRLATADENGVLQLWDLPSGTTNGPPARADFDVAELMFDGPAQHLVVRGNNRLRLLGCAATPEGLRTLWSQDGVSGAAMEGGRLAVGHTNGALGVLALTTGAERVLFTHRTGVVSQLALAAQAPRLAFCLGGTNVFVHDADTGEQVAGPLAHPYSLLGIAISPDGNAVATCGSGSNAHLWRLERHRPAPAPIVLPHLQHPRVWIFSIAFSADGRRIVTASSDCSASVWDATDGRRIASLRQQHDVYLAAFDARGDRVVTTGADGTVAVWDVEEAALAMPILYHRSFAMGALFSPADERLITFSKDRSVRIWRPPPPITRGAVPLASQIHGPTQVALAPQSERAALLGRNGAVEIWGLGEPPQRLASFVTPAPPHLARLSPNGGRLLVASTNGTLTVWDTRRASVLATNRTLVPVVPSKTGDVEITSIAAIAFDTAGGERFGALGRDGRLLLADGVTGETRWQIQIPGTNHVTRHGSSGIAFSGDGRLLAIATAGGAVRVLETATAREQAAEDVAGDAGDCCPSRVMFTGTKHPRVIAAYTSDDLEPCKTLVWDFHKSTRATHWLPHWDGILDVACSPDGKVVATASEDGTVATWDTDTGLPRVPPVGGRYQAVSVSFSRDPGGWLLFALWPLELGGRLFDARTLEPAAPPIRFDRPPREARFLPQHPGSPHRLFVSFSEGPPQIVTLRGDPRSLVELERQSRLLAPRFTHPERGTYAPAAEPMEWIKGPQDPGANDAVH